MKRASIILLMLPIRPCRGRACGIIRRATSCATTCSPATAVLFYHSSCPQPGIAGIARVSSAPYPDPTQFEPDSPYFDPKSSQENPRWILVDVHFERKTSLLSLGALRDYDELADMQVLAKGKPAFHHAGDRGAMAFHHGAAGESVSTSKGTHALLTRLRIAFN